MKRLITIQQGLNVTKDKSGDDGRFKFRSAEDILEKVKDLLKETSTAVVLSDELSEVGGRVAVKATAALYGDDGTPIASTTGWAILDSHIVEGKDKTGQRYEKKTMSNEQCTGSASSYARKYALCGLFAIDNDDDDPDQPSVKNAPTANAQPAASTQPRQQKPAVASTAEKKPAVQLTEEEKEEYLAICADIDASESLAQIKANADKAKGTKYQGLANNYAIRIAAQKGWYVPEKK